jgi:hypothetical protein
MPAGRPFKADRDNVTVATVKVSLKTRQLLQRLKQRHNFQSIDAVLQFYLVEDAINKPRFHTAKELKDMTYREPFNSIIKDAASRLTSKSRQRKKNLSG